MLRNAKELEQFELRALDGKIGHVEDFFFDDIHWAVRYVVVDTGTWLNSRKVLVSPYAIEQVEWEQRLISVRLTQHQVRNSPGIDTEQPVSREHEAALQEYYNWPSYWGAAGFPDVGFAMPIPMTPIARTDSATSPEAAVSSTAVHEDHHLRSIRAVSECVLEAVDGTIGHVEDFLIDDRDWSIHFLVVDTRNWWPGKKVLVSPRWIDRVGWNTSKVYLTVTRAAVKASPPYDPAKPIALEYAQQLHDHYRDA